VHPSQVLTARQHSFANTCVACFVFSAALISSPVQKMFVRLELPKMHCRLRTGACWPKLS